MRTRTTVALGFVASLAAPGAFTGIEQDTPRSGLGAVVDHASAAYEATVDFTPDIVLVKQAGKVLGVVSGFEAAALSVVDLLPGRQQSSGRTSSLRITAPRLG
jgi:hypothetical protein